MRLCLHHFNEQCKSALTEEDVGLRVAMCEKCRKRKACVTEVYVQKLLYLSEEERNQKLYATPHVSDI